MREEEEEEEERDYRREKRGRATKSTTSLLFTNLFRIFISCNFFIILLIPFIIYISFELMQQYIPLYFHYRRFFSTFHVSFFYIKNLEQFPLHLSKFKNWNPPLSPKKTLLPLFSKISPFPRVEPRGGLFTLRINLIKLHRIATRSKDARHLLFLLSGKIDAHP